jgi:hypothetical protein
MTRLLAEAYEKVKQLPEELQDDLALELLDVIASLSPDSEGIEKRMES